MSSSEDEEGEGALGDHAVMSEAAKCRMRNRAVRKAREAKALEEVRREEEMQSFYQSCSSTFVPLACIVLLLWYCGVPGW
jgi:hypothetical protein